MHQSQFQNHYFGHHTRGWPDNCFTAEQLEKRHAIFSVVEIFRCLTDIQALKFNSFFFLAIWYLVLCCFPRSTRHSAEPVKRLWRTLVHQESIKELFIQNIFKREMASTEEVSPFLISLLFPISFSFSSFLAFFPPSSLLLWLSLFPPSFNFFHTSLSPSLDPSPFLFSSSLPPSYFSPTHPFFPAPCSFPAFSPFLHFSFPFSSACSSLFSFLYSPLSLPFPPHPLLIPPFFPLSLAVFCMSHFAVMRETGSLLCRIVTWGYLWGQISNQFPAQPRNSQ